MKDLLKREMGLQKWEKVAIAVGIATLFALSTIFCVYLYSLTSRVVRGQAIRSISNISQLNEASVSRSIENRRTLMETVAKRLEKRKIDDLNLMSKELLDFQRAYDFYSMGIMDSNYDVYLTDKRTINVADIPVIKDVWTDEFHLSESYMPFSGGRYAVNMFSCPIHKDGELKYVLLGAYHSKNLTERMNISSMDGKGYTFLLNSEGEVVIYPQHYKNEEYNALMKHINDSPDVVPSGEEDQYFEHNGEKYYAHFEELGINNWYLMTCAKETDVFADAYTIINIIIIATVVLWGIILFSVCITFYSMHYNKMRRIEYTFYDELTGICNGNAMSVYYKSLTEKDILDTYLIVFDIDKFKEFNYMYGAENGDKLLKYVTKVIQEMFPEVCLFRQVSDCFVIFTQNKNRVEIEDKFKLIDERCNKDVGEGIIQPFEVSAGVRKLHVGETLNLAFSDALIARDTVKGNYLRNYAFYDGSVRKQRLKYMEMNSKFPAALQNGEFKVYYQPKYDILSGEIIGAEALTRWIKTDGTMISPGAFIPCFEESLQVCPLDLEILRQVCEQMKEMEAEGISVKPVSVNLSRVHLRTPDVLPSISTIIKEYDIDTSKLSFEITESALLEENIPMKEIMDYLHGLGCRVDMDDYGVGASNIDALISNEFDTLKLDKSFVDRIGDERAEEMIRSTTHMARKWGIEVLAEGVEEKSQAERLVELGCSHAQGFYYSKPIPLSDYKELLRTSADNVNEDLKLKMAAKSFSAEICDVLDGNIIPTYIIDPENFVVMYCNKTMRKVFGENPIGGLCYKKMRKLDKPCENCSAMRLYRDGDNSPKEFYSHLGVWALIQASPMYWQGKEYIQITGVDITKQKHMEQELKQRSDEYEAIISKSITGIVRYDIATGTAVVNVDKNLNRIEDFAIPDYFNAIDEAGVIAEESVDTVRTMLKDILDGKVSKGYRVDVKLENGEICKCNSDYVHIRDDKGKPYRAVIYFYKIGGGLNSLFSDPL